MVAIFFNVILNFLASLIQIVMWPINQLIIAIMPDISSQITSSINGITSAFSSITWALGLIPLPVKTTLLFILGIEVAKHTIFISTHVLVKVFNLLQKLKFW